MVQSFSPPGQHHRNPVEADIKVLKRTAEAMLMLSLGRNFTAWPLTHTVDVVNRRPSGKVSAYQVLTGRVSNMAVLHTFGEPVLVSVEGKKPCQGIWVGVYDEVSMLSTLLIRRLKFAL
jgi:hypothetical protein